MRARFGLLATAAWLLLLAAWCGHASATAVIGSFGGFLSEFDPGPVFSDFAAVSGGFTYDTDKAAVSTFFSPDSITYLVEDASLSADIGGLHFDDGIGPFLIHVHGGPLGTDFGMRPVPDGRSGADATIPGSAIRLNLLGTDGGTLPDASLPTTSFDVHLIDQPFGFVDFPPDVHQDGLTIFFLTDLTIRTVDVDEPSSLLLLLLPLLGLVGLSRRYAGGGGGLLAG
jgi:hypothetical protein